MMNNLVNWLQCSYDPTPDLISIRYSEESQEELYLQVKFRTQWFLTWCHENGKVPMIDASEYHVEKDANMIVATARIFIDGVLAGVSTAGASLNGDLNTALQTAFTSATGRALANMGFGTVAAGIPSESGIPLPVDSGIQIVRSTENPMLVYRKTIPVAEPQPEPEEAADEPAAPVQEVRKDDVQERPVVQKPEPVKSAAKPEEKPVAKPEEKPAAKPAAKAAKPAAKSSADKPMTLAEAREYTVPIGPMREKKVFELLLENLSMAKWFAGDSFDTGNHYPEFKKAVKIALEAYFKENPQV